MAYFVWTAVNKVFTHSYVSGRALRYGRDEPQGALGDRVRPATAGLAGREVSWVTGADEIFSQLMGDQVELCREFIEQNALNVSSLDIRGTCFVRSRIP